MSVVVSTPALDFFHITTVPTWLEFEQGIARINDELRRINENIGRIHEITDLWRAIDQLMQSPNQPAASQYDREIRKIYEDIRELERNLGRLYALSERLPDVLRNTVREAVQAELKPLLGPAATNIGIILEDNRRLREELASLRAEVDKLKAASNS